MEGGAYHDGEGDGVDQLWWGLVARTVSFIVVFFLSHDVSCVASGRWWGSLGELRSNTILHPGSTFRR
jgi:hypothetical protein